MAILGARKCAAVTLFFFGFQTVASSAPAETLLPAASQIQIQEKIPNFTPQEIAGYLREIPSELGSLRESFIPGNADAENGTAEKLPMPVVFHVQDAHANLEAQARIKEILEWVRKMSKDHGVQGPVVVALEGSAGELHPEYLDLFPEYPEANEAFVRDLKDKGEITGSGLFLWEQYKEKKSHPENDSENTGNIVFWGAENPELYRRNLNQFRSLLMKRKEIDAFLQPYQAQLAIAQSRILNPQLRDFLKDSDNPETLALAVLKHAKPTLGIDLSERIEQIRFPNLARFAYLRELEPLLDSELSRMDWQSLKKGFEKDGIPEEMIARFEQLFSPSDETGVSFRKTVEEILQRSNFSASRFRDYPHLAQWVSYKLLSQEIESSDFVAELERLKQAVMTKLAVRKQEKDFLSVHSDFSLFQKVLHLEVTRSEYAEALKTGGRLQAGEFSKRLGELLERDREFEELGKNARNNEAALQEVFKKALGFYEGAGSRDLEILENALSFYDKQARAQVSLQEGALSKPGVLVLVTGGFHSEGVTRYLKDQGIAHLVVVPRISKIETENLYFKVMRRENSDMSAYFDKNPLNKQESLFLRGLVEKAAPELTQKYGVSSAEIPQLLEQVIHRHPVLSEKLETAVFPGEGKPFVRISVTDPAKKAVRTSAQSVGEVDLLTSAGKGQASYAYLAEQEFDPSLVTTVTVTPSLSGHSAVEKAPLKGGLLMQNLGSLEVTAGPIDAANLKILRSAADQMRNFSGIMSATQAGPNSLILPQAGVRSELRTIPQGSEKKAVAEISLDKMTANQEEINRIVENHDLIYVKADIQDTLTYAEYMKKFEPYITAIGSALKTLRQKEKLGGRDNSHKVFIMKTWSEVGSTQKFFDDIKWFREPTPEEGDNDYFFDVVFQPDFSYRSESGKDVEDQILFGVRNLGVPSGDLETARQERTLNLLRKNFDNPDFMGAASAEQTKNDLFLYLAAKLAHFNDLAKVSERYGADLSVVAYGAGLDKRIRKLFTNPSLGFGGRLAQFLEWVREERLEEVLAALEARPDFFTEREKQDTKQKKLEIIERRLSDSVSMLREIAENPDSDITVKDILDKLPPILHFLFELETVLDINKRNLQDFSDKISAYVGDLKGKKAALIGVGYREGDTRVTKSPAKRIIRQLVAAGVTEFYVSDPLARQSLKEWIEAIRKNPHDSMGKILKDRRVRFYGVDDGTPDLDLYTASANSDFVVIPTDANSDLKNLDLPRLKQSLGDKFLFDGINFFGLRANGETIYSLEALRGAGIRYVSVGRPPLNFSSDYALVDSRVIGDDYERGDAQLAAKAVEEYQAYLLSLETDDERRKKLEEIFRTPQLDQREANAIPVTQKKVAVIGGGYVGLTTGANLADLGNDVTVLDIPQRKRAMDALTSEATEVPIHEPGLRDLIIKGKEAGRIRFQTLPAEYEKGVREASIVYLAVGTPQQDNGAQDPAYINGAMRDIAAIIKRQASETSREAAFKTIVIKSTVTPRVFEDAVKILAQEFGLKPGIDYGFVSNPEFLREGQAIKDITTDLDRTVLGFYSGMPQEARRRVEKDLLELWYPLMLRTPHSVLLTDTATSTLIKYAANAFLAVSITTANVMAQDAALEIEGSNFKEIAPRLRRDQRVGANAFLSEGCGYGGSCFPKDVRAVNYLSDEQAGRSLLMIVLADQLNQYFKTAEVKRLIEQLRGTKAIGTKAILQGKVIALLGMAFKAETDDMREAPSAHVLYELLKLDAQQVRIDDPIFRTPDAPRKEVIINNYLGELYKHFKHDVDFERAFDVYLRSGALEDQTVQRQLFARLRFNPDVQKQLRERISVDYDVDLDEAAFRKNYGIYFDPSNPKDPWDDQAAHLDVRPLIYGFQGLLKTNRIDSSSLKEFYFREVFFNLKYQVTNRVVFVNQAEEALSFEASAGSGKRPADAALLITDWSEYRNLDYSSFSGQLLIDTRNTLYARAPQLTSSLGINLIGPGRRTPALGSIRSELRLAETASVFETLAASDAANPVSTVQFRERVSELPRPGSSSVAEFLEIHPDFKPRDQVVDAVAASFLPEDVLHTDDPSSIEYVHLRLSEPSKVSEEEPLVLKEARAALGKYGWLLDQAKTPGQIILPLEQDQSGDEDQLNDKLFRVAVVLAAADPGNHFAFLVDGTPQQARAQASRIAGRQSELKIPAARILEQFKFVPTDGSSAGYIRAVKQLYSKNKEVDSAVVGKRLDWLSDLEYIPRMHRIFNERLDDKTAILVTAALLRQLSDQYDVVRMDDLLKKFDINLDELVENVARMIQVINHLATQA